MSILSNLAYLHWIQFTILKVMFSSSIMYIYVNKEYVACASSFWKTKVSYLLMIASASKEG